MSTCRRRLGSGSRGWRNHPAHYLHPERRPDDQVRRGTRLRRGFRSHRRIPGLRVLVPRAPMLGHGSSQMSILPRRLTFTRLGILLFCITTLAIVSWACSSGPEIVDPTSTAAPVPTNTLVPPIDFGPLRRSSHRYPSTRLHAGRTSNDPGLECPRLAGCLRVHRRFRRLPLTRLQALGPWCGPRSKESLRRNWAGEPELLPFPSHQR